MLIRLLPIKSRKGLGRDVFDILSHLSTLPTTLLTNSRGDKSSSHDSLRGFQSIKNQKEKTKKKEEKTN